jgi:hypothetical protein
MHSQTAGRPHTVARRATGGRASAAEPNGTEDTPVEVRDRKQREEAGKEKKKVEVMVQNPVDVKDPAELPGRTRNAAIVYEAMDLLRSFGYVPARMSEPRIPINIIAMKKSGSLLVLALRSRLPVPSAAKLRELFRGRVDCLRTMVHRVRERIMIWVYSPACGWRYYLVYPGGLRYDLDFPASLG